MTQNTTVAIHPTSAKYVNQSANVSAGASRSALPLGSISRSRMLASFFTKSTLCVPTSVLESV